MRFLNGFFKRDIRNTIVAIDHEVAVLLLLHEIEGFDAELGGEDAVVGHGGAAALQVSEHRHADVVLDAKVEELLFQHVADAAQLDVLVTHCCGRLSDNITADAFRALGNDDVAEAHAVLVAGLNLAGDSFGMIRDFRDDADVRAAGNGRVQRNPTCITSHHLHDEDAVVTLGGRHQLIDGLRGDLHCRLETEGEVRTRQVVVDGLGHAHHRDADIEKIQGDALRAVTADIDDGVEAHVLETFLHELRTVLHLPTTIGLPHREMERAALVGGLDDGAAFHMDAGDRLFRERHNLHIVLEDAVKRFDTAEDLPIFTFLSRSFHNAANHRVQAGTVAAARRY